MENHSLCCPRHGEQYDLYYIQWCNRNHQPFGVVWHTIGILYSVKHYADWNCQAGKRDCCHQRRTGAYEEMYNNLYELIISDIMMPKIDDYIVKPIELDELLLRVRALLRCWESR